MRKIGLIFVMLLIAIFAISAYEMEPPVIVEMSGVMTQVAMPADVVVIPLDQQIGVGVATSNVIMELMYRMEPIRSMLLRQSSPGHRGGLAVRLKYPLGDL